MSSSSASTIDRRALLAALVTVVFWASAFVGIRAVGDVFAPGSLALARLTIGSALLGAFVWRAGWQSMHRSDVVKVVASGLLWFAFYSVALNEAERQLDAGTASMLVNTGPIFIALLAGLFLGEGLPPRLLAGLAIAFLGSVIIAVATSQGAAPGTSATTGIVLCLAAAVAYASAVTLQKPVVQRVPSLQVMWLACFSAWIACLVFAPLLAGDAATAAARPDALAKLAWIVFLGVFPTSIAFATWGYALKRTPAGRLAATTYLVPPVVIAMALVLLAEVPPALALVGGAACVLGVVIVRSGLRLPGRRRSAIEAAVSEPVPEP
jgi:drug/metabolite transporter (DMT)-like permease